MGIVLKAAIISLLMLPNIATSSDWTVLVKTNDLCSVGTVEKKDGNLEYPSVFQLTFSHEYKSIFATIQNLGWGLDTRKTDLIFEFNNKSVWKTPALLSNDRVMLQGADFYNDLIKNFKSERTVKMLNSQKQQIAEFSLIGFTNSLTALSECAGVDLANFKKNQAKVNKLLVQNSDLKKVFGRLSVLEKKQMQYALKKLGYYRGAVDGIWGKNTNVALSNFISSEQVEPTNALFVLTEKVTVPNSFAVARKPTPKKKPSSSGCRSILSILTGIDELCIDSPHNSTSNRPSIGWDNDPSPSFGSSNSCISDVSCAYGSTCVKRPGKGGQCMKKPRNSGKNFEPTSCTLNTQCGMGYKCDRTYKVCVQR